MPDGACCKPIQKCQPVRSVLSRRGVLSFTVFAAAIALALIILGSPNRQHLVSPGELTSQHGQVVDRCQDCHVAAVGGPSDWIRAALDRSAASRQSDQCLNCHSELGQDAMNPHSQPLEKLALSTAANRLLDVLGDQLTEGTEPGARRRATGDSLPSMLRSSEQLACAVCHREHRGAKVDLTELTNGQCQVCHVKAFHRFSNGHPEYSEYPYARRTRLYFDHLAHYGEHFTAAESQRDHNCSDCHHSDPAGRYMLVKDFELTCAECHLHQIQDDTTLGIAAISLPAVDVDALTRNGRQIGHWPRDYPLHVEAAGAISPLQRILLESYDGYAALDAALSGVDLRDLQDADPSQLQAVESLVWLLKQSLSDVVREGHPEILQRFTSVLGQHVPERQITMLAHAYPLRTVIEMQERWLPSLLAEVEARRAGTELPVVNEQSPPDPATILLAERRESEMLASGWYPHRSSLSLRYRPNGHADPLLKTLLELGAMASVNEARPTLTESTLQDLFDQISSPFAAGRCMKCHTIDRDANDEAIVNWRSYRPPLDEHLFTRFSHAPHVTLLSNDACSKCHLFKEPRTTAASLFQPEFIDSHWRPAANPHEFESNFVPMSKSGCAECHSDDSGRDRCLTCHNYHVR